MGVLSIDFETRGTLELKRCGVYPYAVHRDTAVWCFGYAFDDGEPQLWHPALPFPAEVAAHILAGGECRAWNAQFERVMWRDALTRQVPGVPVPALEQWHCTMAEAYAMALPGHLDTVAAVLKLRQQKDMTGNRLMLQLCRPRRFDEAGNPVWWDTPEKLQRMYAYCLQDVRVEREAAAKIHRLGERERAIYLEDQRINDRGVHLDFALASAARDAARVETERQNALLAEATNGAVGQVTKVAKLKAWLATQDLTVGSLDKAALRDLLAPGSVLSEPVRQALTARQEAAKSSVAKIDAMLDCVGYDGQMRGLLQYHGASTGRWAGRLVQPQNFPRALDVPDIESWIPSVLARSLPNDRDDVNLTVERGWSTKASSPSVMAILSALLRSMFTARPGKVLLCADFASIEARVLAWWAGAEGMLQQFRDGKPIYKEMAAVIFQQPAEEISKGTSEYIVGKSTVLGCGFGMGAEKFVANVFKETGIVLDPAVGQRAVDAYRGTYAEVPTLWRAVNHAAIQAVNNPGEIFAVGPVKFTKRGGYLIIWLPAKRGLFYAAPKVVDRMTPWGEMRPAVEFSGMSSYTHHWERQHLYGGLVVENAVQAMARDLLADAMLRIEARGRPVVLTVHDEVVAEGEESDDLEEYLRLMREVPAWAAGCPIGAEGWKGRRYRK